MVFSSASMSLDGQKRVKVSPQDIPPLPASMVDLIQIANAPDVDLVRLERCIARDQALTMRVLTVANSSFYGCSRVIDSVRGALALLGTEQIQKIVSAIALAPAFSSKHGPSLWNHGLAAALWVGRITDRLQLPPMGSLFTTALVHDIGIVVLLGRAPDEEHRCVEIAVADHRPLQDVELERLGIDHAHLGARVCAAWNLPERIGELIRDHHHHEERPDLDAAILGVADALASRSGFPELDNAAASVEPEPFLQALNCTPQDMDALLTQRDAVADELHTLMSA